MTKLTEWTEPTKDPESLSEVLDSRASLFGLSVNALATQVDVTHAVMNNFLTGKTALQLDKLSKTLEVLDIDVSFYNRRKKLAIKCANALAGKSTEEIVILTKKDLSEIAKAKEVEMLVDCNSKEAFKQYLQKDSLLSVEVTYPFFLAVVLVLVESGTAETPKSLEYAEKVLNYKLEHYFDDEIPEHSNDFVKVFKASDGWSTIVKKALSNDYNLKPKIFKKLRDKYIEEFGEVEEEGNFFRAIAQRLMITKKYKKLFVRYEELLNNIFNNDHHEYIINNDFLNDFLKLLQEKIKDNDKTDKNDLEYLKGELSNYERYVSMVIPKIQTSKKLLEIVWDESVLHAIAPMKEQDSGMSAIQSAIQSAIDSFLEPRESVLVKKFEELSKKFSDKLKEKEKTLNNDEKDFIRTYIDSCIRVALDALNNIAK